MICQRAFRFWYLLVLMRYQVGVQFEYDYEFLTPVPPWPGFFWSVNNASFSHDHSAWYNSPSVLRQYRQLRRDHDNEIPF